MKNRTSLEPGVASATLERRFWAKVDRRGSEDCWNWTAATRAGGYGVISLGANGAGLIVAHRLSYEMHVGPIPDGLVLDHLCRNRTCVNPAHLEPVTQRVNLQRAPETIPTRNAQKSVCHVGHSLTDPDNTYVVPKTGIRQCRACRRAVDRRRNLNGRKKQL